MNPVRGAMLCARGFFDLFVPSGDPSSVTLGDSCLAQVDLALRSAILRCKCKIAKLMCAQKPHCGCLHDAHIRPLDAKFKGLQYSFASIHLLRSQATN